jgi:hypothetical protein
MKTWLVFYSYDGIMTFHTQIKATTKDEAYDILANEYAICSDEIISLTEDGVDHD